MSLIELEEDDPKAIAIILDTMYSGQFDPAEVDQNGLLPFIVTIYATAEKYILANTFGKKQLPTTSGQSPNLQKRSRPRTAPRKKERRLFAKQSYGSHSSMLKRSTMTRSVPPSAACCETFLGLEPTSRHASFIASFPVKEVTFMSATTLVAKNREKPSRLTAGALSKISAFPAVRRRILPSIESPSDLQHKR